MIMYKKTTWEKADKEQAIQAWPIPPQEGHPLVVEFLGSDTVPWMEFHWEEGQRDWVCHSATILRFKGTHFSDLFGKGQYVIYYCRENETMCIKPRVW